MGRNRSSVRVRHGTGRGRSAYHSESSRSVTRSVTTTKREEEERKMNAAEEREENRLHAIEEEHEHQSTQFDLLREAGWFILGLNKFETIEETQKHVETALLKVKRIMLLKPFLEKTQNNLSQLNNIDKVSDVPLTKLFPRESNSKSYNELKRLIDPVDFSRFFDHQVKLGIATIKKLEENIPRIEESWARKTRMALIKKTRKQRKTRTSR